MRPSSTSSLVRIQHCLRRSCDSASPVVAERLICSVMLLTMVVLPYIRHKLLARDCRMLRVAAEHPGVRDVEDNVKAFDVSYRDYTGISISGHIMASITAAVHAMLKGAEIATASFDLHASSAARTSLSDSAIVRSASSRCVRSR